MADQSLNPNPSSNTWMVLYSTYNLQDAYIIAGRLQSEGIQAFVNRQPGADAIGIRIGALGTIDVLVHPTEYEMGRRILGLDDAYDDALEDGNIISEVDPEFYDDDE